MDSVRKLCMKKEEDAGWNEEKEKRPSHGHLRPKFLQLCFFVFLFFCWLRFVFDCLQASVSGVGRFNGDIESEILRSPFAAVGSWLIRSPTGTVPVLSIRSSMFSCSRPSSSASSSSSSGCSPTGLFVIAWAISSLS